MVDWVMENRLVRSGNEQERLSTDDFLEQIEKLTLEVVESEDYHDVETGYISAEAWKRLVEGGILSSALLEREPQKRQEEIMRTIRMLSFYDLHLGLTYGIVVALGVMPLQRFTDDPEQLEEYLEIVRSGHLIGLAVTEQFKSGSAALEMDSYYEVEESEEAENKTVKMHFAKHLQGLSGNKGLIVALLKKGAQRKTVGLFFVHQKDIETQKTEMVGLKGVAYGINRADIEIDIDKHLLMELPREMLEEFQDIFTKSRMLFVAMTIGHLERMEVEANKYAEERMIDGRPQAEIPAVRGVLKQIAAHKEVTEAIFDRVLEHRDTTGASLIDGDTINLVMEANIVKTLSAQYAIEAAAMRAELMGGAAFYNESALQDYIDIWPFQIFEGSKLFLNNQICRNFLAPVKVDRKIVVPGFFSDQKTNFIEYFFEAIKYREMFRGEQISENLDEWTAQMLWNITPDKVGIETRGVIGEIIARLFALGCLTEKSSEEARSVLNLEISQLAQNFSH